MPKNKEFINLVTVGDGQTGKTSLLCVLKDGKLSDEEVPDIFQTFTHNIKVEGKKVELGLWDTSGEDKYEGLRRLSYPTGDVFVVCYSVASRTSFENVAKKWLPELSRHRPTAPVVLVATKNDLRPRPSLTRGLSGGSSDSEKPVPPERFVKFDEGLELAKDIGAFAFLECSAVSDYGSVQEVFQRATKAALDSAAAEKSKNKSGRRGSGDRRGSAVLNILSGK